MSLDDAIKGHTFTAQKNTNFKSLPVGKFEIKAIGYHFIAIKAAGKTGTYLPDIEAVEISGIVVDSLAFNKSEYRGAASVHLRYHVPGDSTVKWFYSEVIVPKEVEKSVNAYYETNGFNSATWACRSIL